MLLVTVILGVLAAGVVPQFTHAAGEPRLGALQARLLHVRAQLEAYRLEHQGQYPTLTAFKAQMTEATRADGSHARLGTLDFPFGPYLDCVPVNPYTDTATVDTGPVGTSAWYYNQATGEFLANDSEGHRAL